MKALFTFSILLLMSFTLPTVELTGQWNGTLNVQGTQIRIVFHVDKKDGQYVTLFDSPDQNAYGLPVATTTFNSPDVKFEMSNLGAVFAGKLSDENITGTWTQSGQTLPLVLVKTSDSPK